MPSKNISSDFLYKKCCKEKSKPKETAAKLQELTAYREFETGKKIGEIELDGKRIIAVYSSKRAAKDALLTSKLTIVRNKPDRKLYAIPSNASPDAVKMYKLFGKTYSRTPFPVTVSK